jgi:hypothetical protein
MRTSQSHKMINHHHVRDGVRPCRAPCFAFDDFLFLPSVTLTIRTCAADESTTETGVRHAVPCRPHLIRRKWTGFVCKVNNLRRESGSGQCLRRSLQDCEGVIGPHHLH